MVVKWSIFPILSIIITQGSSLQEELLDFETEFQIYPSIEEQGLIKPKADFALGSCRLVIDRLCPDPDVSFYLYTKSNRENPETIRVGSDPGVSNLLQTKFDPKLPTKIIIHGYNSDMDLPVLVEVRRQYLQSFHYNIFTVDWGPLAPGPCYPAAVWNIKHVGLCSSQLVERIRELGATDIHVIGFSLGAHVTNHLANALSPYKLPRITGLDPAMPGFLTLGLDNKLDKGDAQFVDVIHTNAFIQGTFLESGHVDFFLNGGVIQPGCWAENRFFACNHHRAPLYFAESINTKKGFWGWPCPSYGEYLLGRCPPKEPQVIMGEHVKKSSSGVYLVITESVPPYAVGKYTGPAIEIYIKSEQYRRRLLTQYMREVSTFIDEDELIESLYKVKKRNNFGNDHNKSLAKINRTFINDNDFFDSLSGVADYL